MKDKGAIDGAKLKALIDSEKREYTFAQTFPPARTRCGSTTGSRRTASIRSDVKTITVPPPQMVANMRVGNMDGFCVGEPWNNRAIYDKIGSLRRPRRASGRIIRRRRSVRRRDSSEEPEYQRGDDRRQCSTRRSTSTCMANRKKVAEIIADKSYVNCPVDVIDQRLEGNYDNGIGSVWKDPDYMKFYNEGAATFRICPTACGS
jgi:nitrate/nitrite transport system substrate-binding protein